MATLLDLPVHLVARIFAEGGQGCPPCRSLRGVCHHICGVPGMLGQMLLARARGDVHAALRRSLASRHAAGLRALLCTLESDEQRVRVVSTRGGLGGRTLLHEAVAADDPDAMFALLTSIPGADRSAVLRVRAHSVETAMSLCMRKGRTMVARAILAALPDARARASALSVLHIAAKEGHTDTVRAALAAVPEEDRVGVVASRTDPFNCTVLHAAVMHGRAAVVRAILSALPDDAARLAVLQIRCVCFGTPLYAAHSQPEVVSALLASLHGADAKLAALCSPGNPAGTVLHAAAQHGEVAVARAVLASLPDAAMRAMALGTPRDGFGDTALHTAASFGAVDVARTILAALYSPEAKADALAAKNVFGDTPLDIAERRSKAVVCVFRAAME